MEEHNLPTFHSHALRIGIIVRTKRKDIDFRTSLSQGTEMDFKNCQIFTAYGNLETFFFITSMVSCLEKTPGFAPVHKVFKLCLSTT